MTNGSFKYSKPRISRTRVSRIFAQLGQNAAVPMMLIVFRLQTSDKSDSRKSDPRSTRTKFCDQSYCLHCFYLG